MLCPVEKGMSDENLDVSIVLWEYILVLRSGEKLSSASQLVIGRTQAIQGNNLSVYIVNCIQTTAWSIISYMWSLPDYFLSCLLIFKLYWRQMMTLPDEHMLDCPFWIECHISSRNWMRRATVEAQHRLCFLKACLQVSIKKWNG